MAALSSKPNNKMELLEFNHKRVINNVPSEPYNELYEANWSMNHENVNVNTTNKAVVPVAPIDHHSHGCGERSPTLYKIVTAT